MTLTDPDRALVERAQAELPYGTKAFDELIGRHSSRVFARCYAILRSHADAEEASQDVFLAVFRSLPRYQFDRPFSHWLSRVTLNACRMILRRRAAEQRRRDSYEREQPPPEPSPTRDIGLRRVVESLLDELDPGMRVALVMRFVEERGYREIAENLGISESAAKMRVSRGAKRLRQLYEERESPVRPARSLAMSDPIRPDEEVAGELLELLRADQPDPPGNLAEKTKQKVRASITSRDLIDLTTIVFVLRFCAPLMDLVAALFGVESQDQRGSHD